MFKTSPDHVSGSDVWVDPLKTNKLFIICTCLSAPDSIFSDLRDGNFFSLWDKHFCFVLTA